MTTLPLPTLSLLTLLLFTRPHPSSAAPTSCAPSCRFTFCHPPSTLPLPSHPNTPQTPPICLNNHPLASANTGEALVHKTAGFVPISSRWGHGAQQSFSNHFFKAFHVGGGGVAIGHETMQKGQEGVLNGVCVALPVPHYRLRDSHTNFNVVPRRLVDCVAFRVVASGGGTSPPVTTHPTTTTTTRATTTTTTTRKPTTKTVTTKPPTSTTTKPTTTATTTNTAEPPVPPVVGPNTTVNFPSTTPLGTVTTFKVQVTLPKKSGSTREDLYFLTDATGSMGDAIATVKARFQEVINARQSASSDVTFGVGFYRDENEDFKGEAFVNVQSLTKDEAKVISAIDTLDAEGDILYNRDTPEGTLMGLDAAVTRKNIGWRVNSRKIVVLAGDAPGHEPSCFGGKRITRRSVIRDMKANGVTLVATSFGDADSGSPGLDDDTVPFGCDGAKEETAGGQATAIAKGTGGAVVAAESQTEFIDSLLSTVGVLKQELKADVSDCKEKGVAVSFEPALPVMVAPGSTVKVEQRVRVKREVCEGVADGGFECVVKFTMSGANAGEQTLKAVRIAAC